MTVEGLQDIFPAVTWKELFLLLSYKEVSPNTTLRLYHLPYFEDLANQTQSKLRYLPYKPIDTINPCTYLPIIYFLHMYSKMLPLLLNRSDIFINNGRSFLFIQNRDNILSTYLATIIIVDHFRQVQNRLMSIFARELAVRYLRQVENPASRNNFCVHLTASLIKDISAALYLEMFTPEQIDAASQKVRYKKSHRCILQNGI